MTEIVTRYYTYNGGMRFNLMCYTVLTDFPPTTKDIVNIVTDDITCYLEFVTPDATLKSKYHFILQRKI